MELMKGVTVIETVRNFANDWIAAAVIIIFGILFISEIIAVKKNKTSAMMLLGFAMIGVGTFLALAPETICNTQYIVEISSNVDMARFEENYNIISHDGNQYIIEIKTDK